MHGGFVERAGFACTCLQLLAHRGVEIMCIECEKTPGCPQAGSPKGGSATGQDEIHRLMHTLLRLPDLLDELLGQCLELGIGLDLLGYLVACVDNRGMVALSETGTDIAE